MTSAYTYTFDDIRNRPVAVIGAGSMRATTLVYTATTVLKKACPHLQLTQAPQR
jgi:hypothetical protein